MRDIAIAMTVSGLALAFAIAFSGRWHVSAFAAGAVTRTVVTDAWTGGIVVCTTVTSDNFERGRTACTPEARP